MGCYNTERKASATVSVEIAKGVQDRRLAPLKVAVCSKYPCTCSGTENDRRRFNLGSKVVLRACTSSTEFMKSHKWEATSPASMAGASFTSRTGSGTSRQQLVTVMINSPISKNVLEPYTFRVAAKFRDNAINSASETLFLNYPPRSGTVRITIKGEIENAVHGVSMKDRFQIIAQGWMDDTEDLPLRYSFDTKDLCTGWRRKLPAPIGNDNSIDVLLIYDLEGLCEANYNQSKPENRSVAVFGSVADRYGSSAELCDVDSLECPIVSLGPIVDMEPANMISDVQTMIEDNQMTPLQAVDSLAVAVRMRRGRRKRKKTKQLNEQEQKTEQKKELNEKENILTMLENAASEVMEEDSLETPRAQGP